MRMKNLPKPPLMDSFIRAAPCPNCKQKGFIGMINPSGDDPAYTNEPCPWCGGCGWIPQIKIETRYSI